MFKKLLAGMFQPELDRLSAEYEQKLAAQAAEHVQVLSQTQQQLEQASQQRDALLPLKQQITSLESQCQQLQSQLQQAQQAQLGAQDQQNRQLEELQAEATDLRNQLYAEAATRQALESKQTGLETQLAALEQQLSEQRQKIETLEAEKARLQVRTQQMQSQMNSKPVPKAPVVSAPVVVTADGDGLIRPPARTRKKVLIVDDAATTRILQKNMLEAAGYEVVMGNDGLQGQAMLPEHVPDLVITDIEMPKMNGFELTSWIKQSPYREVPVLLVTSHSDDTFQQKGLQAGADGFVEKKSFNQKTFLEIIQHYV